MGKGQKTITLTEPLYNLLRETYEKKKVEFFGKENIKSFTNRAQGSPELQVGEELRLNNREDGKAVEQTCLGSYRNVLMRAWNQLWRQREVQMRTDTHFHVWAAPTA